MKIQLDKQQFVNFKSHNKASVPKKLKPRQIKSDSKLIRTRKSIPLSTRLVTFLSKHLG